MNQRQDNPGTQAVQVRRKSEGWHQDPARRKTEVVNLGESTDNLRLTRKQRAVLQAMLDPTNADKTDEQIAEAAGVSAKTFYVVRAMPSVEAERQRMCKALIVSRVAPIIHKSIQVATTADRDGFQDRRLLLSMSGDYVERQQVNHDHRHAVIVGVVGVSPEEL